MAEVKTVNLTPTWREFPRTLLRGVGQVMFQDSLWTGLFFLIGIFVGAYLEGPQFGIVAWGALVGVIVSTVTGYLLKLPDENGAQGLWGFNGVLVGCAFPTFMGNTIWMWLALILCSAMTTWVRTGLNNIMSPWKVSSFTFPFVLSTWFFLLASRLFHGMPPEWMSTPELPLGHVGHLDMNFISLVEYWLKGIAQVFLINSWITGIFFLLGLLVCSWRAALWAAIGSAVSLFIAIVWQGPGADIANGLYGFSAVLTAIALGATFCNSNNWKTWIWAILGIVATVFIQAAMNAFFSPMGLPTLTGPFCIGTWIFLMPQYKMFAPSQN
ncbi:MAG: urea transporter [Muribaculaceae bacterium]|nr:urea transporter [Muribaculaceae bacterium]